MEIIVLRYVSRPVHDWVPGEKRERPPSSIDDLSGNRQAKKKENASPISISEGKSPPSPSRPVCTASDQLIQYKKKLKITRHNFNFGRRFDVDSE